MRTKNELVTADPKSAEIIKPFARGDDTRRWVVNDGGQFIIYTPKGVDIDTYPSVKAHLEKFRPRLEARAVPQPWWELQQAQNKPGVWTSEKIVFPDIAKSTRFALDTTGRYMDMTAFVIPYKDLFLLGILNSAIVEQYFNGVGATIRGGYLRFKRQYVEQIPIPTATPTEKAEIAALVQQCLDKRGQGVTEIEAEINERVAALYGL